MAEIRSAFEIAMERTKDVESDKESLQIHELKQKGKALLSKFNEQSDFDLEKELKRFSDQEREHVRAGLFEVLTATITLPQDENALQRIKGLAPAFEAVIADKKRFRMIWEQVTQMLEQYIQDRQNLIEQLRQQFESRIRQREQQLSQQTGQQIRLDPSQDPEFSQALQQNMQHLQGQYTNAIDQAREELERLFAG